MSSARSIEARCEREKIYNKEQIQSTGVAYSELRNWRYMDDDLIRDGIQRMIVELKENKYAYPVYSNIIELLLLFSKMGLYEGDLSEVQTIMLSLVENDMRVQDENRSPISFRDEDAKHKYLEVYQPIAESRKKRNEIEFWDDEHRCIHLHGKIDLSKLCDKKASILVSAGGMNYKEYAKAVDNIRKTNSVIEFYPNDIVFAPSEVEKDKLVCVTGISPSNRLYPADDLFLYRAKELYADLDLVDELDVFGMSPFGDESIIEKINEKNLIRIFVYNKNENDETKVWESKLKCKYELLESDDMK